MWIEKRNNTSGAVRYRYREIFAHPKTGEPITVSVTLNSNSRHAQKEAALLLREKFEEKVTVSVVSVDKKLEALTVHDLADEWAAYTAPMVKEETVLNHQNYINRIKKAIPETLRFMDLTPSDVEKVVYDMYYTEMLSFSYSKGTLTTFKSILRYARKTGYFRIAVEMGLPYTIMDFEEVQLKRRPATPKELQNLSNKFLDRDELKAALIQLRRINERVSLAMEFIALTGVRCGELLALRLQDYDREAANININGTLVKVRKNGDEAQRGTPKNIYSYRDVHLSPRAVEIIEWFYLENKRLKWKNPAYRDKAGYIFTTTTGNPYNIQYINRQLRAVHIEGKKLSTHIFRHTHISILAENGAPLKAIMQRVGHNDPNTTLSIYTHVTNTMKESCNKMVDAIQAI